MASRGGVRLGWHTGPLGSFASWHVGAFENYKHTVGTCNSYLFKFNESPINLSYGINFFL
jgi:hypothetical protein